MPSFPLHAKIEQQNGSIIIGRDADNISGLDAPASDESAGEFCNLYSNILSTMVWKLNGNAISYTSDHLQQYFKQNPEHIDQLLEMLDGYLSTDQSTAGTSTSGSE